MKRLEAERKRSAPDVLDTPHELACGGDLDTYLRATGNAWACK